MNKIIRQNNLFISSIIYLVINMYIEKLILLNFIVDYVLLDFTSNVLRINIRFHRKILSCLFGEISILYLFVDFNNLELLIFKLFIGIIMILIGFGRNNLIKNVIYFYVFSFLLGGTLYYFKIENLIKYEFILLLIPLFMNIYKYLAYNLKNLINTRYKVTIYLNDGHILYLNGFMDTGNNLIDPITNKKVIIINKNIQENYILVPYKTVDNESLIKCFKPRKVYIDGLGERKDVLVGIVNKKFIGFNCLLNNLLLEDKK